MIKKFFPSVLLLCFSLILSVTSVSASKATSGDKVWREIDNTQSSQTESLMATDDFKTFRLDKTILRSILDKAPLEFAESPFDSAASAAEAVILTLPLPDGSFSRFSIKESPIMEAGLAAKLPGINTYIGQSLDNPGATVRFSLSPTGFRAMILSADGTIVIDPAAKNDTENYISFDKANASVKDPFICHFNNQLANLGKTNFENILEFNVPSNFASNGTMLKTYRLALAATAEYTNNFRFVGENDAQAKVRALEQQIIIMNRVNGIFERDLSVRMILTPNNDLIIYTDSAADPYTNSDGNSMLGQNQTNLDTTIGTANYDIGHVFSTGGGGIATLRSPCSPTSKARGVTGRANPVGDAFSVDYVAHEMGHQFGGNHTFNGTVNNCGGGNRVGSAAYEPGSGVTVMAYAGICGNQNLARNSIDTFHVRSLEEITTFISNSVTGGSCPVTIESGNSVPTVALVGASSYNVPKQTPFTLSATGSDLNNDAITYDWQQYDLGGSTSAVPNTDSDDSPRPLFRSYIPQTNGTRTFPSLQYILNNANVPPSTSTCLTSICLTGELLPSITRTMSFQVIARDNRAGGGAFNTATVQLSVNNTSGPFLITALNSSVTLNGNSNQTVTWDVANTSAAPINAANVRISLSTDGGQTFPTVLANSTANDGSETITIPNTPTATARIKVEAVGNIFFDITDANFTITAAPGVKSPFDFDGDGKTDLSIFRPAPGEWWYLRSSDGGNRAFQFGNSSDKLVPADYTGDGKSDIAIFRPSTNEWFVLRSEDGSFYSFPFGAAGDIPAPADYDGDGKADAAVFRPSTQTWFILRSSGGVTIQQFGAAGDVPVVADYDGDGKADLSIYRPNLGQWWL
ncbi:MAG: reprolysin-like metallopeptidase, partial [Pyrinomonadaceae bacterium]